MNCPKPIAGNWIWCSGPEESLAFAGFLSLDSGSSRIKLDYQVNPDGPAESQVPDEHNGQGQEQNGESDIEGNTKIKDQKTGQPQAKESKKNIGDKHGSIIETGFGLKLLSAYRTLFVHFQRIGEFHRRHKQIALFATRTCHPESTGKPAHRGKCKTPNRDGM